MVKVSSNLNSDMEFIKEFEELRLKQKLLIDSLKKNKKHENNNVLIEINSKLDFIVNIFKDVNENDNENNSLIEEKINELNDKILNLETYFTQIIEKLENLEKSNQTKKEKNSNSDIINTQNNLNNKMLEQIENTNQNLPPPILFEEDKKVKKSLFFKK